MADMSCPSSLPIRARGVRKAMTLAQEQGEQEDLCRALRLVAKYEKKIQQGLNESEVAAAMGKEKKNNPRKSRLPEEHQTHCLKEVTAEKKPRSDVRDIQAAVVHKIQKSLKLYHLRKRARAVWYMRASEDEFLSLFGGYAKIYRHDNGRMFVRISGEDTAAVNALLGPILSIDKEQRHWYCRRFYGQKHKKERDCSYVCIDRNHEKKKEITFGFKMEHTAQRDRSGKQHTTSMGIMFCKFPRAVATVKPLKKYRKKK